MASKIGTREKGEGIERTSNRKKERASEKKLRCREGVPKVLSACCKTERQAGRLTQPKSTNSS